MMKKNPLLVTGAIVITLSFTTTPIKAQEHSPLINDMYSDEVQKGCGKAALDSIVRSAKEVESKRTVFSSYYITKDKQVLVRNSSVAINYYNPQGKLVPIKTELKPGSQGWVADKQQNSCRINKDGSSAISLGNGNEILYNIENSINGLKYKIGIASVSEKQITFTLGSDIQKKIYSKVNGLETDYIINKPVGKEITISEEVKYPTGCTFTTDNSMGRDINGYWRGNYILKSEDGKVLSKFNAPVCYDAKGSFCIGYYQLVSENGKHILKTIVPDEWLKTAVYPITVDPMVSGPQSFWLGGNIPFCLLPNYYTGDSIQVTIPGGITITQFYISTSFQSNFAVTPTYWTSHGYVIMKTSCGKSITLHNPATGAVYTDLPIGSYDFHNPITCCYPPSCSDQSFWLTQEMARDSAGSGCDTDYLYYSATPTVFEAYIQGSTDTAYKFSLTSSKVCSNQCQVKMKVTAEYGVPPYVLSHPWLTGKDTFGTYGSCVSLATANVTLNIPGCPTYCGKTDTLMVPVPIIIDACGDTAVNSFTKQKLIINPAPQITSSPDSMEVCSGTPISFSIAPCSASTSIAWTGSNGSSGTGTSINATINDTGSNAEKIVFTAIASSGGCTSDTTTMTATINPIPATAISPSGIDTLDAGNSQVLTATGGSTYTWYPSTGLSCTNCPTPTATPTTTTTYYVAITNSEGCEKTDSVTLLVIDINVSVPNVVTPNGDGKNDVFYIKGLEYHPDSQLKIFDRWGVVTYQSSNYQNNWNGSTCSDGVYYYTLDLANGKKLDGFFQLIK
ncbi:MAG TPA: gliding motility-associated C-terminal domain-containing protein [Bacteroidia bacterium]|nr:gliding motility-associated C-terminal domain-containing protein [Bacteroidia bacterium]